MSNIAKGLCWAAPIILLALANRLGVVADKTADVLFIVLPVVAILSMRKSTACALRTGRAA